MSHQDQVNTITTKLDELESCNRELQHMVRRPLRDWDSPENVLANLRWILGFIWRLTVIRRLCADLANKIDRLVTDKKDRIRTGTFSLHVGGSGGWGGSVGYSYTKEPVELSPSIGLSVDTLAELLSLVDRYDAEAENAQMWYRQFEDMLSGMPEYMSIKKHLRYFGRETLSFIRVWENGTRHKNKPSQHLVLGVKDNAEWFEDTSRWLLSKVNLAKADNRRVPSFAAGRKLSPPYTFGKQSKPQTLRERLDSFCRTPRNTIGEEVINLPSMLKIEPYRYQNKVVEKIAGIANIKQLQNTIPTILLERPKLVSGDVYRALAVWESDDYQRKNRRYEKQTGYVYFRSNWPDCYHQEGIDLSSPEHADAINAVMSASDSYFARMERQRQAKLEPRKRRADMLRRLRQLPCLSLEDSLTSGNCVPGTRQFVQQLGLCPDTQKHISGRDIAIAWRRKNYVQEFRFAAAIDVAEKRQKQTVNDFFAWAMN